MKKLILLMFLMGCATSQPVSPTVGIHSEHPIYQRLKELTFQIDHDKCFIVYNKCRLDQKMSEEKCWEYHAACVIDVHKRYRKQ